MFWSTPLNKSQVATNRAGIVQNIRAQKPGGNARLRIKAPKVFAPAAMQLAHLTIRERWARLPVSKSPVRDFPCCHAFGNTSAATARKLDANEKRMTNEVQNC